MSSEVSAAVFRFVFQEFKNQKQQKEETNAVENSVETNSVETSLGNLLFSMGSAEEELGILQMASELVEKKMVKKFISQPTGRFFYRIESLNPYKRSGSENSSSGMISQPFEASAVVGNYYNCFDHYCTCAAFLQTAQKHRTTMVKKKLIMCILSDTSV